MVGGFAVALDASVELLAAMVLDGDDVERGMVVLALGAGGYGGAVAGGRGLEQVGLAYSVTLFEISNHHFVWDALTIF